MGSDLYKRSARLHTPNAQLEGEPPAAELFPGPVPVDSSLANEHTKSVLGLGPQPLTDILNAFRAEIDSGRVSPLTRD
jgi:hypothetical protein